MSQLFFSIIHTRFGYSGLVGRNEQIFGLRIGYPSAKKVRKAIYDRFTEEGIGNTQLKESDWFPELQQTISNYLAGNEVSFNEYKLNWTERTTFQTSVHETVQQIPYGETLSYAEVAHLSGHPRAARAVGNVMASNPFPLLIPCHRVLAANKKLGGYSTPRGTKMKQQLLQMENINWKD